MKDIPLKAAVFDLDGVVTRTERVHFAAWKDLFDRFLREYATGAGQPFRRFTEADYRAHVDGRPRLDGVRTFLDARDIELPDGAPDDPTEHPTIVGLGNHKNRLFREYLEGMGPDVDQQAVRLIRDLRSAKIPVGVASSSKNTGLILEKAGLLDLFDARVDGVLSDELGLRGKPEPDIFLECLTRLGEGDATRALVVEDAAAGVAAGRSGGFGLVLGVARSGNHDELLTSGAHCVIDDFSEVSIDWIVHQLGQASGAPAGRSEVKSGR